MINLSEFERQFNETNEELGRLLIAKNNDYSQDDDVHSNFTKQAIINAVLGIDNKRAIGVILEHIVTKLIRICNLLFGNKEPNFEKWGQKKFFGHKRQMGLEKSISQPIEFIVVPEVGIEPTRPCGRRILSPFFVSII